MAPSIEEEIRQTKPFAHPSVRALVSILRTATVVEHATNEVLRPHGLTLTQFNVLRILRGAGSRGLCGREIGERLVAPVPDVSRLLDRMAEAELISRVRDASDRRHVTARLAPKGRRLLATVNPVVEELARARFAGLGAAAVDQLVDVLAQVRGPG